ncbi:MAG: GlsB/YeaQ/YmgE family stress response membrane protein [Acidimicrobiia bacterium]
MLGTLIIVLLFVGIVAGYLARAIVPGPDPMGLGGTILLGIVGSFVGGFLGYVLFGHDPTEGPIQGSDLFGSVIGAVVALLVYRRANRYGGMGRGVGRRRVGHGFGRGRMGRRRVW